MSLDIISTKKMVLDLGVQIANMGESGHAQVVPIAVFVAVLCFCMVIGHLLEENRWVNESITAILIVIVLTFIYFLSFYVLFSWEKCMYF